MNAKPLFILVMFVMLIVLFAGGAIGGADLTPDTPPADVAGISAAGDSMGSANLLYSPCGDRYEVRSGDTLFRIAQACGVTVADIVAANPTISDPNLISPGQQLNLPGAPVLIEAAQPPVAQATAVSAAEVEAAPPLRLAPTEAVAAPAEAAAGEPEALEASAPDSGEGPLLIDVVTQEDAAEPAGGDYGPAGDTEVLPQGLVPGGIIHVTVKALPPKTPVSLGIGKEGEPPNMVEDRITDDKGELIIHMAIPHTAKPGEQWTVSVMTISKPKTLVKSVPFTIQ